MTSNKKWLLGFTLILIIALISSGAAIIFRMDAAFIRKQNADLKIQLQSQENALQAANLNATAQAKQIDELRDKLHTAQEQLDGMDEEMRIQKDKLDLDFQEQMAKERRKVAELKKINTEQRQGTYQARTRLPWKQQLELMKKENPEQYKQLMAARAKSKQRRLEREQLQNRYLDALEQSGISPEKLAQIKEYRKLNEQFTSMRQNTDLTPEEMMGFWKSHQQDFRKLQELKTVVRDELFDQAVREGKSDEAKKILTIFPQGRQLGNRGRTPITQ